MKENREETGSAVDVEKMRKVMRIQRVLIGLLSVALLGFLVGMWTGVIEEVSWWLIGFIAGPLVVNLSLLNQNRQLLESARKPEDETDKK